MGWVTIKGNHVLIGEASQKDTAKKAAAGSPHHIHATGKEPSQTRVIRGPKLDKETAARVLQSTNSAGKDYYTLRSHQTSDLADAAKSYGYRKPKTASGSTARYFHQHLERVAAGRLRKK